MALTVVPARRALARAASLGLAYALAGALGIALTREPYGFTVFWPGNALALGMLLRLPAAERPLALAACAIAAAFLNLAGGEAVPRAAGLALANVLELLCARHLIRAVARGPLRPPSLRGLAAMLTAAALAPAASATFVTALLPEPGGGGSAAAAWLAWWGADAAGLVTFLPLAAWADPAPLARLARGPRDARLARAGLEIALAALLGAAALAAAVLAAATGAWGGSASAAGLLAPVLLVVALRHGIAGTSAVAALATSGAVAAVAAAAGVLAAGPAATVLHLQYVTALSVVPPLVVALVVTERERARRRLEASEQRYAFALEGTNDGLWDWDIPSRRLYLTPRYEAMLGYAPGEMATSSDGWADELHPDDREATLRALDDHLEGRAPAYETEYRHRRKDGGWAWVLDRGKVVERDARGRPLRAVGIHTDLSQRKAAELELARARQILGDAIESLPDAFALYDAQERLVVCNSRYREYFPRSADLMVAGTPFAAILRGGALRGEYAGIDESNLDAWLAERLRAHGSGIPYEFELGDGRWLDVVTRRTGDGGIVGVRRDITERKRLEREVERLAWRDPLTGLANRAMFRRELDRALARARRDGRRVAVLLVDLDRFKQVNDTHGHAAGDDLLLEVGRRMEACVREADLVARLGGDEFAILAAPSAAAPAAQPAREADGFGELAARLVERLSEPACVAAAELNPGASVGFAVFPDDADDGEALLVGADRALYAAKRAGRGTWAAAAAAAAGTAPAGASAPVATPPARMFGAALERGELELDYQPIVALGTLDVVGVEALLRWRHPTRGRLAAASFIAELERGPAVLPVTRFVLDRALGQLRAWRDAGLPELSMWVNIAPRCLRWEGLVDAVAGGLAQHGIAPERLVLEITEGALEEPERALARIRALRLLGARVAIDDFGAGHSSLARLRALDFDVVKIDRAFVTDLPREERDRAIVSAVVALGDSLGLVPTAEGIETPAQLDELGRLGCALAQGFLFARPMPPDELAAWLRSWPQQRRRAAAVGGTSEPAPLSRAVEVLPA